MTSAPTVCAYGATLWRANGRTTPVVRVAILAVLARWSQAQTTSQPAAGWRGARTAVNLPRKAIVATPEFTAHRPAPGTTVPEMAARIRAAAGGARHRRTLSSCNTCVPSPSTTPPCLDIVFVFVDVPAGDQA
eukprot:CAMPEP_0206297964 /NCGR_PEP_ID=MMETSP0106_2-20121207/6446_1 /ASSEMBLY_ACC=CAM_ASM_000206 /TAXON_ID=81532 /ORGANISM="Acanthoeca-like sp., Strain 10tr" /LENGTH=132 /DNA_ID=CAMNT_0053728651 /DNA_START=148 /DNA_END=542 /DNA_ORIENTATION=+